MVMVMVMVMMMVMMMVMVVIDWKRDLGSRDYEIGGEKSVHAESCSDGLM